MTGLLVSVRSAAEAESALVGGADIIDVKEPRHGALGPADPQVWREIQAAIRGRACVSAALGELLDDRVEALAAQAGGFRYAKIGLSGCHVTCGWIDRWFQVIRRLPECVDPVPVAYADWAGAGAPSPAVTLALAASCGTRLLLVDTHDKNSGGLLDHLSLASLRETAHHAKQMGVQLALAGSLNQSTIALLRELRPLYFGVRGAACTGGRDGTIDLGRVKALARFIRGAEKKAAS